MISHKNSANHVLRGNKEQEKSNFNIFARFRMRTSI